MSQFEKSAIIGLFRMGNSFQMIGWLMGISEEYVKIIVGEYFKNKKY